jgi:hypothetical protein
LAGSGIWGARVVEERLTASCPLPEPPRPGGAVAERGQRKPAFAAAEQAHDLGQPGVAHWGVNPQKSDKVSHRSETFRRVSARPPGDPDFPSMPADAHSTHTRCPSTPMVVTASSPSRAHQRSVPAGAGADLQHPMAWLDAQLVQHAQRETRLTGRSGGVPPHRAGLGRAAVIDLGDDVAVPVHRLLPGGGLVLTRQRTPAAAAAAGNPDVRRDEQMPWCGVDRRVPLETRRTGQDTARLPGHFSLPEPCLEPVVPSDCRLVGWPSVFRRGAYPLHNRRLYPCTFGCAQEATHTTATSSNKPKPAPSTGSRRPLNHRPTRHHEAAPDRRFAGVYIDR